jgi:hypothetical protein
LHQHHLNIFNPEIKRPYLCLASQHRGQLAPDHFIKAGNQMAHFLTNAEKRDPLSFTP